MGALYFSAEVTFVLTFSALIKNRVLEAKCFITCTMPRSRPSHQCSVEDKLHLLREHQALWDYQLLADQLGDTRQQLEALQCVVRQEETWAPTSRRLLAVVPGPSFLMGEMAAHSSRGPGCHHSFCWHRAPIRWTGSVSYTHLTLPTIPLV